MSGIGLWVKGQHLPEVGEPGDWCRAGGFGASHDISKWWSPGGVHSTDLTRVRAPGLEMQLCGGGGWGEGDTHQYGRQLGCCERAQDRSE